MCAWAEGLHHRACVAYGLVRLTLPLYTGGFLGPFGGAMLIALIPNVAEGLDTSLALVAGAITAYMVPFAVLQLVSGTLANRLGPRRVVRARLPRLRRARRSSARSSPSIWVFLAGRALMGAANAFLSPILLAALSEVVAPEVLGSKRRHVRGLAGCRSDVRTRDRRRPGRGVVAARFRPRRGRRGRAGAPAPVARRDRGAPASARVAFDRSPTAGSRSSAAKAMLGYLGFTAIGFVVVLVADREFGLGPGARGLVVAGYGVGAIALGRYAGSAVDRLGRPRTALAGALACTAGVLGLAFAPTVWSLALVFLAVGCASAFTWAGLNTITVESFPENRAGATSVYSAFKFAGVAIAPLIYVPLFDLDARAPFYLAAGFSLLVALLLLPWFPRYAEREP